MSKLITFLLLAVMALAAGYASAATTVNLPDPTVYVNLASGRTTVGIAGKYYQAPSQFVYLSPCATPDTSRYHCTVQTESNVVLTASDGTVVVATITAQFASVLITSGHNYWRNSQTVLAGSVTL